MLWLMAALFKFELNLGSFCFLFWLKVSLAAAVAATTPAATTTTKTTKATKTTKTTTTTTETSAATVFVWPARQVTHREVTDFVEWHHLKLLFEFEPLSAYLQEMSKHSYNMTTFFSTEVGLLHSHGFQTIAETVPCSQKVFTAIKSHNRLSLR